MAMAELSSPAHLDQTKPPIAIHMPQPPWGASDERDAYIAWLRSEFAAANAIIDSMCHHLRNIGSPGDYDTVFSCLQKRRHAWASSLYMQQFFSVAEIVNSLQQVGWKKHQAQRAASKSAHKAQCQVLEINTNEEKIHSKQSEVEANHEDDFNGDLTATGNESYTKTENATSGKNESFSGDETVMSESPSHESNSTVTSEDAPSLESNATAMSEDAVESDHGTEKNSEDNSSQHAENEPSLPSNEGPRIQQLLNTEFSIASNDEVEQRLASVKRSIQFHCCEREDGQIINNGETVELCENVFNSSETSKLIEFISLLQEAGNQGELGCSFTASKDANHSPDTIQFGPKPKNGSETNIYHVPKFLQSVIRWLMQCSITPANRRPDSCVISIFDQGAFEPPNTDQCAWEKPLCIISLTGDSTMVFGHSIAADQDGNCKGPFEVVLPAGSVLLLQESFAGILQKSVTASPSKRILIALGKSLSSNGGNKTKSKGWSSGVQHQHGGHGQKQGMLHPVPPPSFAPAMNGPFFPSPMSPYMLAQGWPAVPRYPRLHNTGTGVFFPSSDPHSGASLIVVSSFPSKTGSLLSPSSPLEVRRSRKGDKQNPFSTNHGKVKGSLVSVDIVTPRKKSAKHHNSACQTVDSTPAMEAAAAKS